MKHRQFLSHDVSETHHHLVYWPMGTFQSLNDPLKLDLTLLTVTGLIQNVFVVALTELKTIV